MYSDSIIDLLDNAKQTYQDNDISSAIKILDDVSNRLKKISVEQKSEEIETVEFARLKNFPSRYDGKKIKLNDTAISSQRGKIFKDGYYRMSVSSINQSAYFLDNPYEDGSLFFIISESMLEKLMDIVEAGYVGYFNVYTDTIYKYVKHEQYSDGKTYYVAKIIGLEKISLNKYTNKTCSTGEYIGE